MQTYITYLFFYLLSLYYQLPNLGTYGWWVRGPVRKSFTILLFNLSGFYIAVIRLGEPFVYSQIKKDIQNLRRKEPILEAVSSEGTLHSGSSNNNKGITHKAAQV